MKPWCSLIVAAKNNESTIKYVLRSSLILAKIYDVEIIVVDGNSTDNTYSIVINFVNEHKQYFTSAKVLRDPGTSLSLARHIGFKNSESDVLIFLDGDTILTESFRYYLEKELSEADVISPMFIIVPLNKATKAFNNFMKVVTVAQLSGISSKSNIRDPSILPPVRIFKRKVLEKIGGYPLSSKFFGEDRIATAVAVKLGFKYKFAPRLKLLKIDVPGHIAYWRKHFRYALGVHKDLTPLGKRILKNYIVMRRFSHINIFIPILSLLYMREMLTYSRNISDAINVFLMKIFIDLAMMLGDITGAMHARK
jgi:glycosyltransferase involved in cell wall biosynthesis